MAYYKDLSPYNYFYHSEKEFNIGWLKKDRPFDKWNGLETEIKIPIANILKKYLRKPFMNSRGSHECDFCEKHVSGMEATFELRVIGNSGKIYACPGLVIHYIEHHDYKPPQEFIEAVLDEVGIDAQEYDDILKQLPGKRQSIVEDENTRENKRIQDSILPKMVQNLSNEIDREIIREILNENKHK